MGAKPRGDKNLKKKKKRGETEVTFSLGLSDCASRQRTSTCSAAFGERASCSPAPSNGRSPTQMPPNQIPMRTKNQSPSPSPSLNLSSSRMKWTMILMTTDLMSV